MSDGNEGAATTVSHRHDPPLGDPTPPSGEPSGNPAADTGMRRRWLLLFVALFPLVAMWSLTNPMFASPDETLHMIRAQSIARGDFTNPFTTDGLPVESKDCFAFQAEVPADCQDLTWGADGTERVAPTDGYPPLFHSLAAIPALFTSGLFGAYVMRLWLAAIVVAIVAWAGVFVTRPGQGRWPIVGFLLAMTPMTVFTMSTVNPSGLASAGAILMVAAALALRSGTARRNATIVAGVAGAAILALARRDGIVWLLVLALMLAPLVPWRSVRRRLGEESNRLAVAIGVAVVAVAAVGLLWGRPTASRFYDNLRDGQGTNWWEATRYIRTYLVQAVGVFGWLDSPLGEEGFLFAMLAAGVVVLLGALGRNRRLATATVFGVVLLCLTPVLFGLVRFPYLQGRYLLPMWAGALVVAGASAAYAGLPADLSRRIVRVLLVTWLIIHAVAAVQNLRRYAVGRSGTWGFVFDAEWNPDTMPNIVAVVAFVAALAVAVVILRPMIAATGERSDLFGQAPRHAVEDHPTDDQRRE